MQAQRIIIIFISSFVFFLMMPTLQVQAQKDQIFQKAQKNTKSVLGKNKPKTTPVNNDTKPNGNNSIVEGRRIDVFDYNSITDNINVSNPGGPASKEDEVDLPDNTVFIDTLDFIQRSTFVKTPDMFLRQYKDRPPRSITTAKVYEENKDFDLEKTIFGWHPHWMKNAYESYNFSLLSVVAYYSYELNPNNGSYQTIHDWESTGLIERAHKDSCKVLLSVSNVGVENNITFLDNLVAQRTCISNLISLVQSRQADGIHIDFEGIPNSHREAFTQFVLDVGMVLKVALPEALLSISLPTLDLEKVYQIDQLKRHVDLFVMMGYEFYGFNTESAGPIASMGGGEYWWQFGLENAIDEYLSTGIDAQKLLLTIPYYGGEWITHQSTLPSKSRQFQGYLMYRDIKNYSGIPKNHIVEESSKSAYIVFQDRNNNYHQIWYEDTASLAQKYDWVQEKEIGGIGIWALGYDNGYTDLWQVLDQKFSKKAPKTKAVSTSWYRRLASRILSIVRNPQRLLNNPSSLLRLFGFLTGTSMIGFFMLYRYGRTFGRMFNFGVKGVVFLTLLAILGTIIYMGTSSQYNDTPWIIAAYILGGFILGAIVFILWNRGSGSERDLP